MPLMGLYDNESDVSIVYSFGRVVQMPHAQRPFGLLSSLHDELHRRGLWAALSYAMTPDYARSLLLAVNLDRAGASKLARKSAAI